MKTPLNSQVHTAAISRVVVIAAFALTFTFSSGLARADETCSSPYLARIDGQEEFVYVWTLGVEGMGDGADKLVTVDVKPCSLTYGYVVSSFSCEGRYVAHSRGINYEHRQLLLASLGYRRVLLSEV